MRKKEFRVSFCFPLPVFAIGDNISISIVSFGIVKILARTVRSRVSHFCYDERPVTDDDEYEPDESASDDESGAADDEREPATGN